MHIIEIIGICLNYLKLQMMEADNRRVHFIQFRHYSHDMSYIRFTLNSECCQNGGKCFLAF